MDRARRRPPSRAVAGEAGPGSHGPASPRSGGALMRTVRELAPRSCLELGTAFGVSGAYQAAALELNGPGILTTVERNEGWRDGPGGLPSRPPGAGRAPIRVAARLAWERARSMPPIDYAFLEPTTPTRATLAHFATLLPHLREGAIVVFDDINWSDGMWRAWRSIAPRARIHGAELRRMGIIAIAGMTTLMT